jgi:hypothetical protein
LVPLTVICAHCPTAGEAGDTEMLITVEGGGSPTITVTADEVATAPALSVARAVRA